MRSNHLDLHMPDVAAARDFFVAAFGLGEVETRGNDLAILRDDAALELVVSHAIEKFGGADTVAVGRNTYHVGFILSSPQGSRRAVRAGWGGARRDRAPAGCNARRMAVYWLAPGRILIEVGWCPGG